MSFSDLFRFDQLAQPLWLGALPLVAILLVLEWRARPVGSVRMSTGARLAWMERERRSLARFLPPLLRALGLTALVIALAGPLAGYRVRADHADVVDIMLCVDLSSSMAQSDFFIGTTPANRLDVTKVAVANFIESRRLVPKERFGVDRLGLVVYAGMAWTLCPLTLDYAMLEHEIARLEPASDRDASKSGTAIGAAIGLGVRRLSQSEAKSKVIVLLTDGMNNRHQIAPMTAARIAAAYGVKIYTLGVGPMDGAQQMGQIHAPARLQGNNLVDEASLREIAAATGGSYFRATDLASLEEAYREINTLEATRIEASALYDYDEAHRPWIVLGGLLMVVALFSRRIWFEVLP